MFCIFLTRGTYLSDSIISPRRKVLVEKKIAQPYHSVFTEMSKKKIAQPYHSAFTEMPVQIPESKWSRSCICVLGVNILPISTIFHFIVYVPLMWNCR